jgi:hypothetical protein
MNRSGRRSKRLFDKAVIGAIALGVILLLAGGYAMLHGGSDGKAATDDPTATLPPESDAGTDDSLPPSDGASPSTLANLPGFSSGSSDTHAYAFTIGDTKIHTVTLSITTDGPAYLGYQFRNGKPHKVLGKNSFSITQHLRGPSPIAQVAGQVVGSDSYTTCAIYIDGKKAISKTVRGLNNIAFCGA